MCETLWGTIEFEHVHENGGIFDTLEMKTKDANTLKEQALSGVLVRDTADWYTEVNQLFPEETDTLETRYDLITEHYKTRPVPQGKSVCIVVATHAAFNMNLPQRFNA